MTSRVLRALLPLVALAVLAAADSYTSLRRKFDLIESDRLQPGARVQLSVAELDAYAAHEAPAGVRHTRLRLVAPGVVTGSAVVDFVKLRRGQGYEPGWLMSTLLEGERPVSVTARIQSGGGTARVDVQRVEIGGVDISGGVLDFLIRNVLLPLYPDALVGRPFELSHRIEKLDVRPSGVTVVIGR